MFKLNVFSIPVVILVLLLTLPGLSHTPNFNKVQDLKDSKTDVPLVGFSDIADTDSGVNDIIENAHAHLEIHAEYKRDVKTFFANWVTNFNILKMGLNAYRWANANLKYEKFREHILNLAFLLPVSHLLEISFGPIGVIAAEEMGLGSLSKMAVASVGAVISIPGLDPLCIILMASYKIPSVQKGVSKVRWGIYRGGQWVYRNSRLKSFLNVFIRKQLHIDYIFEHSEAPIITHVINEQETHATAVFDNAKLTFVKNEVTGDYLHSMEYSSDRDSHELNKFLKLTGFNIRNAIHEIFKNKRILDKSFHIQNRSENNGITTIHFVPHSLPLTNKFRIRSKQCNDLFFHF